MIILTFTFKSVNGQIFDNGQNPPGVKWEQINTENFQVLYPAELKTEGIRMANTLEHLIASVSKSLNKKPKKITVILQNQGVVSNGFVQLAPRRSEFFTTPSQNFDVQDWLNSLAVHELRHVVQFDKLTGKLKAPFFEELALAIFGITLPSWFFEGDAVGVETALSHAGRGRLPDWELIFRTNTLSTRSYSYSKNFLGSFKDPTAGYYQLGYFMTTKLKRDYGKGIMDSVMSRIARNPVRPYNLSNSVKKFTGLSTKMLYDSTLIELKSLWSNQAEKIAASRYESINLRKDGVPSDYLMPVRINEHEILVLKTSFARTPAIVRISESGREKEIIKIGFQTENNFTYASNKFTWDEYRPDPRFKKRSYNVINIYNLETGTFNQLTHRTRLFSPALSKNGKIIAAVKIGLDNRSELIEMDAETGQELRSFPNPENYILQTPSYSYDGKKIICVAISKDGAALLEFDTERATGRLVLPFQFQQVSRPIYAENKIVFRAHYKGLNNIYSLEQEKVTPISSTAYSASNVSYDENSKTYLFNDYQVKGYDIATLKATEEEKSPESDTFINYAAPIIAQEGNPDILDSIPSKIYTSSRYRESANLFYFHSLSPIAEQNDFSDALNIGLKLKSNNKLNTLDLYAGYQFNNGLKKSEYVAGITYKRFYPIIDIKYVNRARLSSFEQIVGGNTQRIPLSWRENHTEMEISIPFQFNRLNQSYNLGFSTTTSYTSRYEVSAYPGNFYKSLAFPLLYQAYFNRNSRRSLRDLAPKWGQNISFAYQSLPFDNNLSGEIFTFKSQFFAPGLLRNHSLQAGFNYQHNTGAYQFSTDIPRVSGYSNLRNMNRLRNTLLMDYRFPLFYPDAELGGLAYIKRVKGGFFADYENIGKGNAFRPRTYGLELSTTMNLLRFYLPDFDLSSKLIFLNEKSAGGPIVEFGFTYGL